MSQMIDVGGDIVKIMRSKDAIVFEVAAYQGADMGRCINAALELCPYCKFVGWRSHDMPRNELYDALEWIGGRYAHWGRLT